jgi:glycosyltransferase involved in cell wall biosynthesis
VPSAPSISVLIRTFNSGKTLDEVLTSLDLAKHDECIIVDSGSTDRTLDIAATHNTRIIQVDPPFNYSRSLNIGFNEARSHWVLVLSSHCIPLRPDLLARMRQVASTSDDDIAVIYGRISLYDPGLISEHITIGNQADWKARRFPGGGNGFAMYPKKLWETHGFDEELVTAEDLDWLSWAFASGYNAALVTDATVLYRNQGNLIYMFRKGWNETLVGMKYNGGPIPLRSSLRPVSSLITNCLHLTKLLVHRRIGLAEYFRMNIHGLGANLASLTGNRRNTSIKRGSNENL